MRSGWIPVPAMRFEMRSSGKINQISSPALGIAVVQKSSRPGSHSPRHKNKMAANSPEPDRTANAATILIPVRCFRFMPIFFQFYKLGPRLSIFQTAIRIAKAAVTAAIKNNRSNPAASAAKPVKQLENTMHFLIDGRIHSRILAEKPGKIFYITVPNLIAYAFYNSVGARHSSFARSILALSRCSE